MLEIALDLIRSHEQDQAWIMPHGSRRARANVTGGQAHNARVAFRKTLYRSIAELQADLDRWMKEYNELRSHQGRWCFGKTPMQTFLDALPLAREKMLPAA